MGDPEKVETLFTSEISLVGMVLAISFAILLLTGLALYISFRVRETLREEHGKGARVAKVAFLIGLLFLSGGIFYFFSTGITARSVAPIQTSTLTYTTSTIPTTTIIYITSSGVTKSTTSTSSSVSISSSATTSTVTSSDTSSSSTVTSSSSSATQDGLSLVSSFPTSETTSSTFYGSFTIVNNSTSTASSVTLQAGNLFSQFTFQTCSLSVNGGSSQDCSTSVGATSISIGNVPAGTTVITLGLKAPSQAGQYSYTVTMYYYLGSEHSVATTFTIHVTA